PDKIYCLGVEIVTSSNGGQSFSDITNAAHVDTHALWVDPANPSHVFLGRDGGFFSSTTEGPGGAPTHFPLTQFSNGAVDASNVNRLLGGTQDNNTLLTSAGPAAWSPILGGDGFQCLVDPTNPSTLFAEYQFMSEGSGPLRSVNGGASWSSPSGF